MFIKYKLKALTKNNLYQNFDLINISKICIITKFKLEKKLYIF